MFFLNMKQDTMLEVCFFKPSSWILWLGSPLWEIPRYASFEQMDCAEPFEFKVLLFLCLCCLSEFRIYRRSKRSGSQYCAVSNVRHVTCVMSVMTEIAGARLIRSHSSIRKNMEGRRLHSPNLPALSVHRFINHNGTNYSFELDGKETVKLVW